MGRVHEGEAAGRDTGPEARGDVADVGGGRRVPVRDEEGRHPARDADFGPLVAKDEEGAQDGGFVGEGGFEGGGDGGGGCGGGGGWGRGEEEGAREEEGRGVGFVGAEGEEGEDEVDEGDGEGDGVKGRPGPVVGDKGRGHERADGGADAVGAVEAAEGRRRVGEVGREDVVGGQVGGHAEAEEEKGDDDDGEGRPADEHDVGCHHDHLGQDQRLGPAQSTLQQVADGRGGDEADGVCDENQRHDRVAYLVVSFQIGDESTRGPVVQAVTKIHEANTQHSPPVDRRIRP